jgi:hypothetical protein
MPSFWDKVPPIPSSAELEELHLARKWSLSNNNRIKPCLGAVQTLFLTVVWGLKLLSAKMQQYGANTGTHRSPPMPPQEAETDTFSDEEESAPVDAQPISSYPLALAASKRAGRLFASPFLNNDRSVFADSPFSLNQTPKSRESSFFDDAPPSTTPRPSIIVEEPSIV